MSDDRETTAERWMRRLANYRAVAFVAVAGAVVIYLATFTNSVRDILTLMRTGESPPRIQIECHLGVMPKDVPSGSRIYVLSLFPTPIENGGGGLIEYFPLLGGELKWPSSGGFPKAAYNCHLTNYGDAPVFNVEMAFGLTFLEAVRDEKNPSSIGSGAVHLSRWWPVYLAKINSGGADPFVFYVMNESQYFVYVSLPETATFQFEAQGDKRTVRLVKPPDSPAALLNFSPVVTGTE